MAIEYKYSHRHGTSTQWANSTDILKNHEIGIEYAGDDIILVFGDGVNTYANLKKINLSKIGVLETQMDNVDIPTKVSELVNDSGYVLEDELAAVATSGSYNDLLDKPTNVTLDGTQTITGAKTFSRQIKADSIRFDNPGGLAGTLFYGQYGGVACSDAWTATTLMVSQDMGDFNNATPNTRYCKDGIAFLDDSQHQQTLALPDVGGVIATQEWVGEQKEFQDINTATLMVTESFTAGPQDHRFSIDDVGLVEYKGSEIVTMKDIPTLSGVGSVIQTVKQDGYPSVGEWVELFESETRKLKKEVTDTTSTVGTVIADVETGVETTIYEATGTVDIGFGRSNITGVATPEEGLYEFNYNYDADTGIITWHVKHDNPNQSVTIKFEYETIIYTYLRIK